MDGEATVMSGDLERLLEQLTARGAPAPLRERVLGEVYRELKAGPASHLRRWGWAALAASLLLGVALNVGLTMVYEARFARIYGPEPVPRQIEELTRTIAKMTDEQTASQFREEFLRAVRQRPVSAAARDRYLSGTYSQMPGKD
jgi:hypothetical protein